MPSQFDPYIHEMTRRGKTYYAVARWDEQSQTYVRAMDGDEKRMTGCQAYYAKELKDLPWHGTLYTRYEQAVARARLLYGRKSW